MFALNDLAGKNVLITGGANGIGKAMVEAFAQQGSTVHFCDVDQESGRSLAKKLGQPVNYQKVDLTSEKQIHKWIDGIVKKSSQIDVLINNAARDPRIDLEKMSAADWDKLFALNIRSFFLTAQRAADHMPPESSIVNFSSVTFHLSPASMTGYVATKAAIVGFTQSLARELGSKKIRVNTLSPGWVMTERQLEMFVTSTVKKMLKKEQCIPKLIEPEEIANVALFLASQMSSAITSQEILVDRGWANAG